MPTAKIHKAGVTVALKNGLDQSGMRHLKNGPAQLFPPPMSL
jgi:hypothetical protein